MLEISPDLLSSLYIYVPTLNLILFLFVWVLILSLKLFYVYDGYAAVSCINCLMFKIFSCCNIKTCKECR